MDKEELELKEQLRLEKKAILEERKRKREECKTNRGDSKNKKDNNKGASISLKAVYISNLPIDYEVGALRDDLIQEFNKFGDIERNKDDEIKCKLYMDDKETLKGDALIVYHRKEYALLAIEMMNGYNFKGNQLKVEYAKFNEKKFVDDNKTISENDQIEDNTVANSKKRKLTYNTNSSINGEPTREKTLVLTNVIDIYQDLDSNELKEIEEDLLDGCKLFGSIVCYDMNIDRGEFHVTFSQRDEVLACLKIMNGRYFDGRKLSAYILDEKDLSDNELETNSEIECSVGRNEDFIESDNGI